MNNTNRQLIYEDTTKAMTLTKIIFSIKVLKFQNINLGFGKQSSINTKQRKIKGLSLAPNYHICETCFKNMIINIFLILIFVLNVHNSLEYLNV